MQTDNSLETKPKKQWLPDNLQLGLLLGLLTPVIGVIIYYYTKVAPNTWNDFISYVGREKKLLSSLTVICLLPNIALFTLFINTHKDKTAKGIFATTLIYAIASLLTKFLG